ncbi:FAD-dependent oxidoreductase [Zooshikella ganghwensis]|uniref:FAD-dependent oxidoreductase n=2 Tax=Zooshikella ganghwensis TaxID=202772 RepID=A0A4P9VG51_9GAMM|nr:FAD-dependent oxidoreductase [Zooshikella ganghwensis]
MCVMEPLIIIGTGLAGYTLAKEYRKHDSYSPLTLITTDDGRYYSKPMLSIGMSRKQIDTADAQEMAEQLNATILTNTRVTAIDPQHHLIKIGNDELRYRQLVLAWGADVLQLDVQGDGTEEIYSVNNLQSYEIFRKAVSGKKRVAIIGSGLVGCEFANDLIAAEHHVELISQSHSLMPKLLPADVAAPLQSCLQTLGVRFHFGVGLEEVNRIENGLELTLTNGKLIHTDVVLSAIGIKPHITMALEAGLEVNEGIQVNHLLETSAPDVFALGDCAEVEGHVLLYVAPLMACAKTLARTLAGHPTPLRYGPMPVGVKTPICPVVVCPPPRGCTGQWQIHAEGLDVRACFVKDEKLFGYALTGRYVKEKYALNKQLTIN